MSTVTQHPDAQLKIREAYEKYYLTEYISEGTRKRYPHDLARFARLSGDPPIGEIDDNLMHEVRQKALAENMPAGTINTMWRCVRAVLRRVGPRSIAPNGLGIIDTVPWMKSVPPQHKIPKRVKLDDLSKVYVYCAKAQYPRTGVLPADWWRCLLVVAYFTALRKSDLLQIKLEDINLQDATLDVEASKTGKADRFPLHPICIEHISRIWGPREYLFAGFYKIGSAFYKEWHPILDAAGVEQFGLQDIRKTAASEIERASKGMAPVFLQHAPRSITAAFYINATEELEEAILKMRVPTGFNSGPKMAAKTEAKAREERVRIRMQEFHVPTGAVPSEWKFRPGMFWLRGRWYRFHGMRLAVLKALVKAGDRPVTMQELVPICVGPKASRDHKYLRVQVHNKIVAVRARLRAALGLHDMWDPVPCVERGTGGAWTIWLPPEIRENGKGGAA